MDVGDGDRLAAFGLVDPSGSGFDPDVGGWGIVIVVGSVEEGSSSSSS